MVDLSFIIPSWNTRELLRQCLNSIYKNRPNLSFEVWVIDNASTDGSVDEIPELFPEVKLVKNSKNLGYAGANNQAARSAEGANFLLLNSDTVIHLNAVDELFEYLSTHANVAAVGPKLLNGDGSLQISASPGPSLGREFWRLFHLDHFIPIGHYPRSKFITSQPLSVEVLLGACIMVKKSVIDQIGLFDEEYFMYSEEVDLCERIRKKGWALHWLPGPEVTHFGGMSTRQDSERMFLELYRNKIKFFRKHRGEVQTEIYRSIIWVSSLVRVFFTSSLSLIPSSRRKEWKSIKHNYMKLLGELPLM